MSDTQRDNMEPKEPTKRRLRLDLNPKIEVPTSNGPLFLHEASSKLISEYAKQAPSEPLPKVRRYLGQITSDTYERSQDKYDPLPDALLKSLTVDDVERLAQEYLQTWNNQYYIAEALKDKPSLMRGDSESAITFLDKLIDYRARHSSESSKRVMAALSDNSGMKSIAAAMKNAVSIDRFSEPLRRSLGFTNLSEGLRESLLFKTLNDEASSSARLFKFDPNLVNSAKTLADLHKQADDLSSLANDFRERQSGLDKLRSSIAEQQALNLAVGPSPVISMVREHEELRRKEHAEEIALTRQIGEMSVRSSELLAQLSNTGTTFLGKFGDFLAQFYESNRRADAGARRSLGIAVWALALSALISGFSAWVAQRSYTQDTENNLSNDKWQQELSLAIKKQADAAENSLRLLSTKNEQLRRRVEELEQQANKKTLRK